MIEGEGRTWLWRAAFFSKTEVANPQSVGVGNQQIRAGDPLQKPMFALLISHRLKTCFDVVSAVVLLFLFSPLFIILAFIIRCDGGPVFFSHRRIGRGGKEFGCLKFRSMVPNSQEVLQALLQNDPIARSEWEAGQKLRYDPRITHIGRFLRMTSLDEIPQLMNVLQLNMSMVGPRPIVQEEVSRYGEKITDYYNARPGLTGLWQVSGRSSTTYDYRVMLDSHYVRNWSLWQDVVILVKTIPAVLGRRGAH